MTYAQPESTASTVRFCVDLDRADHEWLTNAAARLGIPKTKLIRRLLAAERNRRDAAAESTALPRDSHADLAGSVPDRTRAAHGRTLDPTKWVPAETFDPSDSIFDVPDPSEIWQPAMLPASSLNRAPITEAAEEIR